MMLLPVVLQVGEEVLAASACCAVHFGHSIHYMTKGMTQQEVGGVGGGSVGGWVGVLRGGGRSVWGDHRAWLAFRHPWSARVEGLHASSRC